MKVEYIICFKRLLNVFGLLGSYQTITVNE
jgi:hypothetical protein